MHTRLALLAITIALTPAITHAQSTEKVTSTAAGDMVWQELAPGITMSPLWQDPATKDTGLLLQFAPGFTGIKHAHTNAYHGVTVQGTWVHIDDDATEHVLPKGSVAHQPALMPHSDNCISDNPCIVLVHLDGEYDFFLPK